ncbi:hypothetical protein PFISCL1PPCAC_20904, partial [Pristionchus fissidentatus]
APVSAHFVGNGMDRRIKLFTTSVSETGVNRLVCIEGPLTVPSKYFMKSSAMNAYHTKQETYLTQDIHMIPHYNEGNDHLANVISTRGNMIDVLELTRNGSLRTLWANRVGNAHNESLQLTCADVAFHSDSFKVFIIAATTCGAVWLRTWGLRNKMTTSEVENKQLLNSPQSEIISARFFNDSIYDCEISMFFLLKRTEVKVFKRDNNSYEYILTVPNRSLSEAKVNQAIPFGDGRNIHDLLLLYENRVHLYIGRDGQFKKRPVELVWKEWLGEVMAACTLTTRTQDTSAIYLDLVFVSKNKGRIGVVAALHHGDSPADVLQFDEWPTHNTSTTVAMHAELIKCESSDDFCFELTVRLFALKKSTESINILIGRLVVDTTGFRVEKVVKLSKIRTSIPSPHHFAMQKMPPIKADSERIPPKYAIVTGIHGSEVARICNKLEQVPEDF